MTKNKSAVFILLGQSNAVGHGIPMQEKDIISSPLKNVYGLYRQDNQSFNNTELVFSNYTSFGMNLAEEQDNTYSLCNCLGILWQKEIDSSTPLPDLYIIQIAIGAQGVTEKYMWYPEREKRLVPGKLGTVDISLFPLSQHIFSLLDGYFKKQNREYEIIGLHWRGGEEDMGVKDSSLEKELPGIYTRLLDGFNSVLCFPPIVLHKLCCPDRAMDVDPTGGNLKRMEYINSVFDSLSEKYPNVSVYDVRSVPHFIEGVRSNGIFIGDAVHFTPETNFCVAGHILEEYKNRCFLK